MERGWVVVPRVVIGEADAAPVTIDVVLLHPARGVALLQVPPRWTPDAPARLRRRLAQAQFTAIFPGFLPVVHVSLPRHALDVLPQLLAEAFAAQPPLDLAGSDAWVPSVWRALLEEVPGPEPGAAPHGRRLGLAGLALAGTLVAAFLVQRHMASPSDQAAPPGMPERLATGVMVPADGSAAMPAIAAEILPALLHLPDAGPQAAPPAEDANAVDVAEALLPAAPPSPARPAGLRDILAAPARPPLPTAPPDPPVVAAPPGLEPGLAIRPAPARGEVTALSRPGPERVVPLPAEPVMAASPPASLDPPSTPEPVVQPSTGPEVATSPPVSLAPLSTPEPEVQPPAEQVVATSPPASLDPPSTPETVVQPPSGPAVSTSPPVSVDPPSTPETVAQPPAEPTLATSPPASLTPLSTPEPVVQPTAGPVVATSPPVSLDPPSTPEPVVQLPAKPTLATSPPASLDPPSTPEPVMPPPAEPVVATSPPVTLAPSSTSEPVVPPPAEPAVATSPPVSLVPDPAPPRRPLADPALLAGLLRRGDALLALGDVSAARRFYQRAAEAGSAAGARAAGRTHDPAVLADLGVRGISPNPAAAAEWYRRADALAVQERP